MPRVDDYYGSDMALDSFTNGNHDARRPTLNPGEYFVTYLEFQLKVFESKRMSTVEKFKQRIEHYVTIPLHH
jgi:hypothetical protein